VATDCRKGAQGMHCCSAHGGGKRCRATDCTKGALGTHCCSMHGGGRRCQHAGCPKQAQAGGTPHCIAHGGGRRCQAEGCVKAVGGGSSTHCRLCLRATQAQAGGDAAEPPQARSCLPLSVCALRLGRYRTAEELL
jgi:hypothetical protein